MILKIFAVRDRATDMYGTPMFLVSSGQAVRGFADEINRSDQQNGLFMHPDDYDLYELGEWDSSSAVFSVHARPEQVAIGKQVKIRN